MTLDLKQIALPFHQNHSRQIALDLKQIEMEGTSEVELGSVSLNPQQQQRRQEVRIQPPSEHNDVALEIAEKYSDIRCENILEMLAQKPDAFSNTKSNNFRGAMRLVFAFIGSKVGAPEKETKALQLLRTIWEDIVRKPKFSTRALFIAAEMGNTEFVVELIHAYPELCRHLNDNKQTIFHIAVKHRHQNIYNLLYQIGPMKDLVFRVKDEDDNSLLHLAGMRAPRLEDVPGVLLQMQQELLWFKEVESIMPAGYKDGKNKDGLTPRELFTVEHRDLVTQGETWVKQTARQHLLVAMLLLTIAFASTFIIPSLYDQNIGVPLVYAKRASIVFLVADTISFLSASASILMFLSILASPLFALHDDFLESLLVKLLLGLATLFLSITTMPIALSVGFSVVYDKHLIWKLILITTCAAFLVLHYVISMYSLSAYVIHSTHGLRSLFKLRKNVLL